LATSGLEDISTTLAVVPRIFPLLMPSLPQHPRPSTEPSLYMGSDTTRKFGMARIKVLTALKVKQNLKPGMYADGLGLYLKVRPGNSKSWIFRYRTGGRLRDMGLGPFHTVSLAEAREKAEVCRAMRIKGLDPLEERLKEQQAKAPKRLRPSRSRSVPRPTSPPTRTAGRTASTPSNGQPRFRHTFIRSSRKSRLRRSTMRWF
jgi:Arm DNA-binding domain